MKETTKTGLGVLEAAALLGILGDALLRETPLGLNVFLWMSSLTLAAWALGRRRGLTLAREGYWLIPALLLCAAAFAWRDSPVLKFLDFLMMVVLCALSTLAARGVRVRLSGLTDYALSIFTGGLNAMFGSFALLFKDIGWSEIPRNGWMRQGWMRHVWAAARGLLIAVPLLLLFGALFMAADAVYDGILRRAFNLNIDSDIILSHVFLTLFFAWITAGFLRWLLFASDKTFAHPGQSILGVLGMSPQNNVPQSLFTPPPLRSNAAQATDDNAAHVKDKTSAPRLEHERPAAYAGNESSAQADPRGILQLGIVEIGIVLGLINLLFFSFVAVQVRYFFGGAEWVVTSTGLTYAEYARRGFFELVWVGALVLPLLLAAHWLLRKDNPAHERIFRILAGALVALLFIIMASAVKRMRLYQSEYGMTELRLYTTAFMLWLAVVFVWFAWTVLRGQRARFACGALVAGLLVVAGLHLLNPDAFIVRTNAALVHSGRSFDAGYATSLSADAVPALFEVMPTLSEDDRNFTAQRMLIHWKPRERPDWRTWNWSSARAANAMRANETSLRERAHEWEVKTLPAPTTEAQANED